MVNCFELFWVADLIYFRGIKFLVNSIYTWYNVSGEVLYLLHGYIVDLSLSEML